MTPVSKPTFAEIAANGIAYAIAYHPKTCLACIIIFSLVLICAALPTPMVLS